MYGMMNSAGIVINSFSEPSVAEGKSQMSSRLFNVVSPEPDLASGTEKVLTDYLLNESKSKTKREMAKPNIVSL